jgi:hypothetical protein
VRTAGDEQPHTTCHRGNPQDRRKRQRLLSIRRRVQGTDVDDRLATRVGDALIDERRQAEHDQHQTNGFSEFHAPSMTYGRAIAVCTRGQPARRHAFSAQRAECANSSISRR